MSSRLARSNLRQRQYQPHHTGRRDALLLTDRLGVDVHRRANISMAKKFLVDLHVHPELPKHRGVLHLVYSFSLADDPLRATLGHSHFDAIYLRDRKMPFISKEFRSLMLEIWHVKYLQMPRFRELIRFLPVEIRLEHFLNDGDSPDIPIPILRRLP